MQFSKDAEFNSKDRFLLKQLGQILNRRYIEILREEMSGVYTVRTRASLSKDPYGHASMQISMPTSPESVDSLVLAAIKEIKDIQKNGVTEKDMQRAKEIYKRDKEKNLKENKYWIGSIKNCLIYDESFDKIASYDILDEFTAEEIQRVAKEYINSDEYLKVVLYPEEAKSEE